LSHPATYTRRGSRGVAERLEQLAVLPREKSEAAAIVVSGKDDGRRVAAARVDQARLKGEKTCVRPVRSPGSPNRTRRP
jgi:hypothetical protein